MSTENSENRNFESNNEQNIQSIQAKRDSDPFKQKEEIKQSFYSATDKAKEWTKIARDFQCAKRSLKSYRNILLEFLFEKLGYKYKGHINHPNFLHLCAEAWLLGIFQELERELNGDTLNLTFHGLINLISNLIVKENAFIENMEMLIGRFSYLEPFAKEEKIFRNILIDLNSSKNEVLKDDKILKNFELSYEKFVGVLEKILRIAFNVFLNNINSTEENKKSNLLYNNFEALRKQNNLSFEEFQKSYLSAKNLKDIPSDNLRHQLLGYYEFSLSCLEDLLQEVRVFSKNAASVIFKIFSVLPKIYLFDLLQRRLDFLKYFPGEDFSLKNFRLENLRNFVSESYSDAKYALTEASYLADDTGKDLRKWVNTIPAVQMASNATYDFYSAMRDNYGQYFNWGLERFSLYFSFLKNVTLAVKETLGAFVITVFDKSVGSALCLQRAVFGFIGRNFQVLKTALIGNEPLFRVYSKDDDFYSIEINKRLFILKPELFFDFFAMVKGYLGKIYDLRFVAGDVAGDVKSRIIQVASGSENEPAKQNVEMSAQKHEKLKEY